MYSLEDYSYTLPEELIAQVPASSRDQSRLMVLERKAQRTSHHHFKDIVQFLSPGDLLVLNNTRVVPARLVGTKETGGRVEALLLTYPEHIPGAEGEHMLGCECLVKSSKRPRKGSRLFFDGGLEATVLDGTDGVYNLEFQCNGNFDTLIHQIGQIPLPPYVKRDETTPPPCNDRERYQTVYAEKKGAVAAPTAGLHFTSEVLSALSARGVGVVPITLHVGYGTFLPVRVEDIRDHHIHAEAYQLTKDTAEAINQAKDEGRRIIAVGTTTVRVLEFAADPGGRVKPGSGKCDLYIYPGFEFKVIDALMTNFHLPGSTLLMLVAAFVGRDFVLDAYREAIRQRYRFFSYGDGMLIL
jgi:S-adenosylmethionine:tRNA ribosyltransferase-isomerase